MKKKLFWPIVLIAVVIIFESVLLISKKQNAVVKNNESNPSTEVVNQEGAVTFEWTNEANKVVLTMRADKEVAIDAIDLYVAYKNAKVISTVDSDELTKPTFSKISADKSLVVMDYLISDAGGFKMVPGQTVKVTELNVDSVSGEAMEFSIDPKTQVVENGSAKVLPFNSQNLIINSSL